MREKETASTDEGPQPGPPREIPDVAPTVGRIVHFAEDGGPYASIVSAVNVDGSCELATFGRNSLYFQHDVHYSADGVKGTWRYPPRA